MFEFSSFGFVKNNDSDFEFDSEYSTDLDVLQNLPNIGIVISVGDGIARCSNLEEVGSGEMVLFIKSNVRGIALNLEEDVVSIMILGNESIIFEGDIVKRLSTPVTVPVGPSTLGRVLNSLGASSDDKNNLLFSDNESSFFPIEVKAPGIIRRKPVRRAMITGIKAIDSMIPVGQGQRELIIGDRQTGKTAIAIDSILYQVDLSKLLQNDFLNFHLFVGEQNNLFQDNEIVCIYVAIGQKKSTISQLFNMLMGSENIKSLTVILASASDPVSLQFLAPYSGCTMGEY